MDEAVEFVQKRLDAGQGETLLLVGCGSADGESPGLNQEQLDSSLESLTKVCEDKRVSAGYTVLRRQALGSSGAASNNEQTSKNQLWVAYCLVRRIFEDTDFVEVRVAVVGNVDAGKSTVIFYFFFSFIHLFLIFFI